MKINIWRVTYQQIFRNDKGEVTQRGPVAQIILGAETFDDILGMLPRPASENAVNAIVASDVLVHGVTIPDAKVLAAEESKPEAEPPEAT